MSNGSIWLELLGGEVQQHYYDAGGVRTRVLEAGTGHPLVLLHGTGGHAETYARNLLPLAEHFRVLSIDMIGHGFSARAPGGDYTLDVFADHVVALLDAIGAESCFLEGESLGGGVACWTALKYPDRVDALCLNTGILARPDEKGLKELDDLEARTKQLVNDLSRETVRRRLEWLVLDPAMMTEEMVDIRLRVYSQPGMVEEVGRVMETVLQMNRDAHGDVDYYSHTLANIKCPTLVLWTDHNPGKAYEVVKPAIDAIPNHEFHMIKDAAHWPQWEKPEEVNERMTDFLLRVQRDLGI